VARKLAKCRSDLVGVQEVRWDKGGPEQAENYAFLSLSLSLFGKGSENHQLEKGFFVHQRTVPELVIDRMSYVVYVVLSGHWCAVIVLSVRSPTKDTSNDTKDSFYEE
jgi:hypothetical protein